MSRTAPGRGAWLCEGSPGCLELALRRNAFSRALDVSIASIRVEAISSQLARPRLEL